MKNLCVPSFLESTLTPFYAYVCLYKIYTYIVLATRPLIPSFVPIRHHQGNLGLDNTRGSATYVGVATSRENVIYKKETFLRNVCAVWCLVLVKGLTGVVGT